MIGWLQILRERVEATSQVAVARELGLGNHTAISLVLAGKYPAKTDRFALKVMTRYARVECPFLKEQLSFAECREYHEREAPTSSQFAVRHWKQCQQCPHNHLRRAA